MRIIRNKWKPAGRSRRFFSFLQFNHVRYRQRSGLLLFQVLFAIIPLLCCHCVLDRIQKDPEAYLLNELKNKRILMIGDFAHHQPLPRYGILKILDKWVSSAEQGAAVDRNIILVLERDSVGIALLKNFFKTKDPKPLIEYQVLTPSNYGTLEDLEYYYDLQRLSVRIDSLNARLPQERKISFDLFGPEENNPNFLKDLSGYELKKAWAEYVMHVRDSVIALRIRDCLSIHHEAKAIIFYGDFHLQKTFVDKNYDDAKSVTHTMGYCLAYYLKKAYGDSRVLSVDQIPFNPRAFKLKPWVAKKIGADAFYIAGTPLPSMRRPPDRYDGFLARTEPLTYGHEIRRIFSQAVVHACLSAMDSIRLDSADDLWRRRYVGALSSLQYLCGKDFGYPTNPETWFNSNQPATVLKEWIDWLKDNGAAIYDRMNAPEFKNELKSQFAGGYSGIRIRNNLLSIGFRRTAWDSTPFVESRWNNTVWPETIDRIKLINAIGRNWFGDSAEQASSHDFLVGATGQNFSEPDFYLKWFRNHKDSVSY